MDWTTILNALVWGMGLVGGGFVAYGGWLCLYGPIEELRRLRHAAPEVRPADDHGLVA